MLVTSNYFFSHYAFYPNKDQIPSTELLSDCHSLESHLAQFFLFVKNVGDFISAIRQPITFLTKVAGLQETHTKNMAAYKLNTYSVVSAILF